jgi:hypothetical protein
VFIQLRETVRILRIDPFNLNQLNPSSRLQCIQLVTKYHGPGGFIKTPDQETLMDYIKVIAPAPARRERLFDVVLAEIELGCFWREER